MSYRRILVEPAKTGRSSCHTCKRPIEQNTLRVHVKDARAFREALRRYGEGGEGMSRGYVQTENGAISVEKYFVHLECYRPVQNHPFVRQSFDLTKVTKAEHKAAFSQWLNRMAGSPPAVIPARVMKKKRKRDQDDEDWRGSKKTAKKKKITRA